MSAQLAQALKSTIAELDWLPTSDATQAIWERQQKTLEELRKALAAFEAAPQQEPFAWATHHEEPMLFPTHAEAAQYCEDDEEPVPLYAAPQQEPVAWRVRRHDAPKYWIVFLHYPVDAMADPEREVQPLYAAPQQAQLDKERAARQEAQSELARYKGLLASSRLDLMREMKEQGWTAPQQAQAPGWQPIETAPKDGSLFMCWVSAVRYGETDEGQQYQQDVSQVDFCSWRTQADIPDCGWFDPCCGQIGDEQGVTHWMPLPAAPQQGSKS